MLCSTRAAKQPATKVVVKFWCSDHDNSLDIIQGETKAQKFSESSGNLEEEITEQVQFRKSSFDAFDSLRVFKTYFSVDGTKKYEKGFS